MASRSSSSSSTTSTASAAKGHGTTGTQQTAPSLYSLIMTPLNFTIFLVSLLLVDARYTLLRAHGHPSSTSRLPVWLQQLLYRPTPYQTVGQGETRQDEHGRWHYHSKQKKLMRMEADEAFQLRNTVMLLMGAAGAVLVAAVYVAGRRLFGGLYGAA
ncbi:hypothetical protein G7046_g4568 [Stylonectria norvegica]|nr:hypothetical protein G7046_g4568 [Stylonectria norvegica]